MKNTYKVNEEAVKKIAERVYDNGSTVINRNDLEELFPELKESEDEKIRKELINAFQESEDSLYMVLTPNRRKSFIAWLEKQGGHVKFINGIQVGDKVTRNEDGVLVNLSQLNRVAKKQGEQKPADNQFTPEQASILDKHIDKYLEQNPDDKVEPEFKIGDLITNGILIGEIDEIHELGYHAYFGDHYADVPDAENWHKWTIQDAKDGDMLAVDNMIFIYERTLASHIVSYCKLINDIFEPFDDARTCCECNPYVHPTTKEQRGLLFQKMHEAGYMWDAEKKELKKIEHKNDWNEEDKIALDDALWCCKQAASIAKDENDMGNVWYAENWLKSLKDRVQPQKQEWSDVDKDILFRTIDNLKFLRDTISIDPKYAINIIDIEREITWLKSLKERYTWKPSEEQMNALREAVFEMGKSVSRCSIEEFHGIESLYSDLKKLNE